MSFTEDPGSIQYPGFINNTQTIWALKSPVSGNFTVTAASSQTLLVAPSQIQTIRLTELSTTNNSSLFSLSTTIDPPPLVCNVDALYNYTAYVAVGSTLVPVVSPPTLTFCVAVKDSSGNTLYSNVTNVVPVAVGGTYTATVSGTVPIYAGQTIGVYYVDVTGATSGTCITVYGVPSIGQPTNAFLSLTPLMTLTPLPPPVVQAPQPKRYRVPQNRVARASSPLYLRTYNK